MWLSLAATAAAIVIVAVSGRHVAGAHTRLSQVTWTTDIAAIVEKHCVGCHVLNGFGPMSLATYQDARAHASEIRTEVLEGRMPPWPAARGFGDFNNDRTLTPLEVELIAAWTAGATPLGPAVPVQKPATAPRAASVRLEVPAIAGSLAAVERFELPTRFDGDRWIAGFEFVPGNRAVVEQAVLSLGPSAPVGTWVPPEGAIMYPSGVGQRLPAGARLNVEVRYRKGAAVRGASHVILYFGGAVRHALAGRSVSCGGTAIEQPIDVLSVRPQASEAGAPIEITAVNADGSIVPVCVVSNYQPGYAPAYRLRRPVRLARGTLLDVRSPAAGCGAELVYVVRP